MFGTVGADDRWITMRAMRVLEWFRIARAEPDSMHR
jgi:hypothetical protein